MTDSNTAWIPRAPSSGGTERRRVTPIEIQQKEFGLAFRGYKEREVDEFLDQVTDEVARLHADNKRLREELEARGTVTMDTGAVNEADDVVQRAHEHAARIVAEAEADAARIRQDTGSARGGSSGGSAPAPPEDFLARERRFLQNMANLIQGHASSIKDELRRYREDPTPGTVDGTVSTGARDDEEQVPDEEQPYAGRPADAGPPTQAWSPAYDEEPGSADPGVEGAEGDDAGPSGFGSGPYAMAMDERIDERTHGGVMAQVREERVLLPSIAEMPAPPARGGEIDASAAGPGDAKERTLRELFWGED